MARFNPIARSVLLPNRTGGGSVGYSADNPVYQSPLMESGCLDDCHKPEQPKCGPVTSFRKFVKEACPDWVKHVQPKTWGKLKLLVADGNCLGFLRSRCKGPVYVDGDEVTVGFPDLLTHVDSDDAVIENGLIPLALKSRVICEDDAGNLMEKEVVQHGYQQLRDTEYAELTGLRRDCATGCVRQDVIQPIHWDQVEQGFLDEFCDVGFIEEEYDLGEGCMQKVKRWYAKSGAVFGPREVIEDDGCSSYEASLIPQKFDSCDKTYQLAFRKIEDKELVTEDEQGDFRLMLAQVTEDPDCPGKVSGHCKHFFPLPNWMVGENPVNLLERIEAIESALNLNQ